MRTAASTVSDARAKLATGIHPGSGLPFYADLMPHLDVAADVVVQIAVADEVIY